MKNPTVYFCALALLTATAAAQTPESIKVGDVTYRNPTIRQEFPRSILINHDEGLAFLERENLSPEDLAKLSASAQTEEPEAAAEESKEAGALPDATPVAEQETEAPQESESAEAADEGTAASPEEESEAKTAEATEPSPETAPELPAQE